MKRFIGCIVALLLSGSAYGQEGVKSATIQVHHIRVSAVNDMIQRRQGIEQLTLNYKENSVTVRGDEVAVDKFKADLMEADVPPTWYRMTLRLVRYHIDAGGKATETNMVVARLSAQSNHPSTFQVGNENGFSVSYVLYHCVDNTMNVNAELRKLGADEEIVNSGKSTANIKLGESERIVGITDAKDTKIRRAVRKGQIVNNQDESTSYYVYVKLEPSATQVRPSIEPGEIRPQ